MQESLLDKISKPVSKEKMVGKDTDTFPYTIFDNYAFTSIDGYTDICDAIIIKNPQTALTSGMQLFGDQFLIPQHSIDEYISFINSNNIEKALVIADNINFIKTCPSLTYLYIFPSSAAGDGFDYSPLYSLKRIRSLNVPTKYGEFDEFSTSIDYSQIKGLENLGVEWNKGCLNYQTIKSLKSLMIWNCNEKELTKMFCSPVLDTLLIQESKIRTLEGIQQSTKMQCLYLYYNRGLKDIEALGAVKDTLRALRICNCSKIEDFSILSDLKNLELLEIDGSNKLESLNFLNQLPNLKTLYLGVNVLDGDLTPCMNLSYAWLYANKRHYNLKREDLPHGKIVLGNENIELFRRIDFNSLYHG